MDFDEWMKPAVLVSAIAATAAIVSACASIFNAMHNRRTRKLAAQQPTLQVVCTVTPTKEPGWHYISLKVTNLTVSVWRTESLEVVRPRGGRLVEASRGPKKDREADLAVSSNIRRFAIELQPAGTVRAFFGRTAEVDSGRHECYLFVPPRAWVSARVLLLLHCASLDAVQRHITIDIHRTLSAQPNDEQAQSSSTT